MIRNESIPELIKMLNEMDECDELEAKECSFGDVGKSVFETICALANEPDLGGGTILLGVHKEEGLLFPLYTASGVTNTDKITLDLSTGCASKFNFPVRVEIKPEMVEGKVVLRVNVAELPATQKPLYFTSVGLPKGAYRRVGSSDIKCSDEDLQAFFHGKAKDPYDARVVAEADWEDLDPSAIMAYRKARSAANPVAEELNWSDEEMLHSLGAVRRDDGQYKITITGLLMFGKASALRRHAPAQRVDYIRVPGKAWVPDPDARFDSLDMRGPLVTLIPRVIAAITDDLPKTFVIGESLTGQRTETPVLPVRVIREAVVNSLMHRSYEVYSPVQIIRYANRIVIKNPGYSLKSEDRFDEPGSAIRNPTLAEILHETRFAETKGSGIRVMQAKMKQSGLAAPTFESDRSAQEFSATFLFHHFLDESDWEWLSRFNDLTLSEEQMRALIFVREVGAIDNSVYRSLTSLDTLSASKGLRALVQLELLRIRGSGTKTHYVAGPELVARNESIQVKDGNIQANNDNLDAEKLDSNEPRLLDLPVPLRVAVRTAQLKKRLTPEEARKVIFRLCDWKPQSVAQIASYLSKNTTYVSQKYITPMVSEGILKYFYPEMPQHPQQKYQSPRLSEEA